MAQAPQLYPSLAGAEAAAGAASAGARFARFRFLAAAFWLFFCFLAASWPLLPRRVMGLRLRFLARPSESELPTKSLSVRSEPLSSEPLSSEPWRSFCVSANGIIISVRSTSRSRYGVPEKNSRSELNLRCNCGFNRLSSAK